MSCPEKDSDSPSNKEKSICLKGKKKLLDFNALDPDEIIDPASLNLESDDSDEDADDAGYCSFYSTPE